MTAGSVEAIYVVTAARGAPTSVDDVAIVEGRGLEGDRYANHSGSWFKPGKSGQHVTLIEGETIDALHANGIAVDPGEARRNIVTRGIHLDDLIGHHFRLGTATLVGVRPCPPCAHLEAVTAPGIKAALENRGGLRADVVHAGRVRVGDEVRLLEGAAIDSPG